MLDDHACRVAGRRERFHALPGGVRICEVVERQLFTLQLPVGGDRPRRRFLVAIEGGLLMRVFAVAQILHLDRLQVEAFGKRRGQAVRTARGEPVRNCAVVGRSVRKGLSRERETRLNRQHLAVRSELGQERAVVRRFDHDAHMSPVLRRGAQQRRTADVDVLDRFLERAVAFRDSLPKRVEVDDDEIDQRNAVPGERRGMRQHVAAGENAGVHFRMQRLHTSVEHFGKSGVLADFRDGKSGIRQCLRRAPGRQELYTESREPARKLDEARLVGYRKQRLSDWGGHDEAGEIAPGAAI